MSLFFRREEQVDAFSAAKMSFALAPIGSVCSFLFFVMKEGNVVASRKIQSR